MQVLIVLFVSLVCGTLVSAEDVTTQAIKTDDVTNSNDTDADIDNAGRIVGGWQAQSGWFPWMVGVHGMSDNGQWERWRCGGALIARNLILTAAHCVDATPRRYRITLGSLLPGDSSDSDGKTIRYADLIIKQGEGCILRMSESVSFTDKIRPVGLPSSNDYLGGGQRLWVSGWGGTGENNSGKLSERLLYTIFDSLTQQQCTDLYNLGNEVVCYKSTSSTTCGGDSGSPVVHYDSNNAPIHVAIHNAGFCKIGSASVGIRTNMLVNWINSEIRRHAP